MERFKSILNSHNSAQLCCCCCCCLSRCLIQVSKQTNNNNNKKSLDDLQFNTLFGYFFLFDFYFFIFILESFRLNELKTGFILYANFSASIFFYQMFAVLVRRLVAHWWFYYKYIWIQKKWHL
jgi:hypothetical protein